MDRRTEAATIAELVVRHTRRHMPTRRVAVEAAHLPAGVGGPAALLVAAIGTEFRDAIPDDDRQGLRRLLRETRGGLTVPRIAVRHRLQTDTHGLDTSRHRILREAGRTVVELDVHGRPEPQLLGTVLGIAALGATAREEMLRVLERALQPGAELAGALDTRGMDIEIRHIVTSGHGPVLLAPRGQQATAASGSDRRVAGWEGIPAEHRWAMEVLGMAADLELQSADIHARFRRLVRRVHPDHGAEAVGAAERIAELREARERLLAAASSGRARR